MSYIIGPGGVEYAKPIIVPVTRYHRIMAEILAESRLGCKSQQSLANNPPLTKAKGKLTTRQKEIHQHIVGTFIEIGFGDTQGLEPDKTDRPLGDEIDFPTIGTEVKGRVWRGWDIILPVPISEWHRKNPDFYVLGITTTDEMDDCKILGKISREKFDAIKGKPEKLKPSGPWNYCVRWKDLEPVTIVDHPRVRMILAEKAWLASGAAWNGEERVAFMASLEEYRQWQIENAPRQRRKVKISDSPTPLFEEMIDA